MMMKKKKKKEEEEGEEKTSLGEDAEKSESYPLLQKTV